MIDNGIMDELRRKTAELEQKDIALRRSEKIMRTILDASPVGMCLIDDRTIQWGNNALYTSFGYHSEEMSGMPMRDLYASEEEYIRDTFPGRKWGRSAQK